MSFDNYALLCAQLNRICVSWLEFGPGAGPSPLKHEGWQSLGLASPRARRMANPSFHKHTGWMTLGPGGWQPLGKSDATNRLWRVRGAAATGVFRVLLAGCFLRVFSTGVSCQTQGCIGRPLVPPIAWPTDVRTSVCASKLMYVHQYGNVVFFHGTLGPGDFLFLPSHCLVRDGVGKQTSTSSSLSIGHFLKKKQTHLQHA